MSKRILIIDSLNLFLRSYIVNPTLSKDGNPIGGTINGWQTYYKCRWCPDMEKKKQPTSKIRRLDPVFVFKFKKCKT